MPLTSNYTTLIFDIGDALRNILSSSPWIDYERGKISQAECYARVGGEFSIDPTEVGRAFADARDSLQSNEDLISVIRHLKARSNGMLRVFAMSNISAPDYEDIRNKLADWSLFDDIFTSAGVGERKPTLGFYKAVLSSTGADPSRTIFVDDKTENVLSARSLGMRGIIFDDNRKVIRALYNLLGEPVERGREYLTLNAKKLQSVTDTGILLRDNFAQLLILEATHDRSLVDLPDTPRIWNFFEGKAVLCSTEDLPSDLETTSLGWTILNGAEDVAHSVMDEMLDYIDDDGIIQLYFDHRRPRFDPVACINILALFYSYGRGHQLNRTLHWIREVLLHRAYLDGTRYYATPECFLYFLGRLLQIGNDVNLVADLKPLLIERVQERIGAKGDALALSMRLRVCAYLGLRSDVDIHALLSLQCEDGSWEIGWIYHYGVSGINIGNRGLTTAMAIKAIVEMQRCPSPPPSTSLAPKIPSPVRLTSLPNLLLSAFYITGASLQSLAALLRRMLPYYQ
ncbi:HAD-like domain-containing protein [Suillus paluster]|uniref:HAD-like domain-containing protein n=1 Tax=Suillus paluster TaxID=48578 RepID=UPI001B860D07|nr:HAD-like domain-containing protein [Suillus paluster]KAG1723184.1 HAD-like domain-containing protein [Suillus paluster]